MQINLWYNESMKEWRWTLIDSEMNMESGGQSDLRLAMNDVATTVEYLISKEDWFYNPLDQASEWAELLIRDS